MSQPLLKKHKSMLIVALVLSVVTMVGVGRFGLLMQSRKQKVIHAKQELATYEENKKIFSEESLVLASLSERAAQLEKIHIVPSTTPDLLSKIEAMARDDRVDFSITSVEATGAQTDEKKLFIDFSAKGTRSEIDQFLAHLNKQSYQIRFTKLTLFVDGVTMVDRNASIAPGKVDYVSMVSMPQWKVLASLEIVSY